MPAPDEPAVIGGSVGRFLSETPQVGAAVMAFVDSPLGARVQDAAPGILEGTTPRDELVDEDDDGDDEDQVD
jgi:hypothetical protein